MSAYGFVLMEFGGADVPQSGKDKKNFRGVGVSRGMVKNLGLI